MSVLGKDYESIVEQIKKVKALADNGVDGEKENAKNFLEKLLKKHKVSLDELLTVQTKEYKFRYKTEFEKKILFQCIAKYANIKTYKNYLTPKGKIVKNVIAVDLTKMQFLDIEASAKFYVKLFTKDLNLFFTAFITKHKIFRDKSEDEDSNNNESELSLAEIEAIVNMMAGLTNSNFIPSRNQLDAKK